MRLSSKSSNDDLVTTSQPNKNWHLTAGHSASKERSTNKFSQKSISLIEKPLHRVVSSVPPTTSVNDLVNHDVLSLPIIEPRKSFSRKSMKKPTAPRGSMESVVCGAGAKEVGGLHQEKNFYHAVSPSADVVDANSNFPRSVSQCSGIQYSTTKDDRSYMNQPPEAVLFSDTLSPWAPISQPPVNRYAANKRMASQYSVNQPSANQYAVNQLLVNKETVNQGIANQGTGTQSTTRVDEAWYDQAIVILQSLSWSTLFSLFIAAVCLLSIAMVSSLFCGILCGSFVTYVLLRTYTWLLNPDVVFVYLPTDINGSLYLKNISLHNFSRNPNESTEERVREFKGWMNLLESEDYDPHSYHISNTETVLVILEGTTLRMKKPLEKDIPKRAVWNEAVHSTAFVQQLQVEMTNFLVNLKPESLSHSRIYSKRFPICLTNKKWLTSNEDSFEGSLFHSQERRTNSNFGLKAIFLFARTNKEKEEWYRRLEQASRGFPITTMGIELQRLCLEQEKKTANEASDKAPSSLSVTKLLNKKFSTRKQKQMLLGRDHTELLIDYMKYMANVIAKGSFVDTKETAQTVVSDPGKESKVSDKTSVSLKKAKSKSPLEYRSIASHVEPQEAVSISDCDTGTMWINALLQRIFFDFFREGYWRHKMQVKLQKKLDKITLPFYLGPLIIDKFSLGTSLPLLKRIGQPYLSDDGLWVDSELGYSGGACMTIETKINLNVLKNEEKKLEKTKSSNNQSALGRSKDSHSEESSNSSAESVPPANPLQLDPKKGEHPVTKFFNSLKDSRYFQKLADTKIIKSAMDRVSKTPLKLSVEVKYIAGLFSVSIPPPPTDRIWFGFRKAPELILTATPIVGAKSVNLAKLSQWIEEKLTAEFNREFVIPNMIDRQVPLMCGNYEPPQNKTTRQLE
ncbi:testis-expressed protein 2-like [Watersipora subatra]|uniref:testis-expressed protein 2-like n=1 Tax=Watersipora subatra TaxID=2589382 RepID=UPI00355BC936